MKTGSTLFELSYEDWCGREGLPRNAISRETWSAASRAEWRRIETSLRSIGHWHGGAPCVVVNVGSAKCTRDASEKSAVMWRTE
jgi:hypothetical protein